MLWIFLCLFLTVGEVAVASNEEDTYYPLMVGFSGTHPEAQEVEELKDALARGLISGVIFFRHNVVDPKQVGDLTDAFMEANTPLPPLLAVDQEGGRVQRLSSINGFESFPSAKEMGEKPEEERQELYKRFAGQVRSAGFNYVLGPVVDLHKDEAPAIGALSRSFGEDPEHVAACARDFIDAHKRLGIATSLKHFPGHGFARRDTHKGFVDVTDTFDTRELLPFENLAKAGLADSIMVAHVTNKNFGDNLPASLSPHTGQTLRDGWGYDGVVISDDFHMGAIVDMFPDPCEVGALAARAGVDLLLYSYNKMAAQGRKELPQTVLEALQAGIREKLGEDFKPLQQEASRRVNALRERLWKRGEDVLH
ncbi:MAG: hypothetical protein C0514_05425 [Candidatus Puniceispirillum sp.]|nr:hypothetical protein [Candidatus Puniceispirillum sp.]